MPASKQELLKDTNGECSLNPNKYTTVIEVVGNVDAELIVECWRREKEYSQAIIITGDGDFTPLVKILQDKDKFMRVIAPNRKYASSLLRKAVGSHITFMQEISQKVKRRKGLKR